MNRLVLIGNGFDQAHDLKTSYNDFINWYWDQRLHNIVSLKDAVSEDILCSMRILPNKDFNSWYILSFHNSYFKDPFKNEWVLSGQEFIKELQEKPDFFKITYSPFFERINKSIETKKWVDIENEYYELLTKYSSEDSSEAKIDDLNKQLLFLQDKLVEYLKVAGVTDKKTSGVEAKIYAPFKPEDISIGGKHALEGHVKSGLKLDQREWDSKLRQYNSTCYTSGYVDDYKKKYGEEKIDWENVPIELLLPNQIMLLSFNYTQTASLYCKDASIFQVNQIHGKLDEPGSVIFGYGDEIDEKYKILLNKNDNTCLANIKSIKYLEADNYRKMLSFIEAEPFQVFIMGHSCGNSDRTLLNTLFEHPNCVSIKPYYHVRDDGSDTYLDIVQNISRNFTKPKLMRDRVVNKIYCEPLPQAEEDNE